MTTTRSDNESSLDAGVVCATGESDMAQEYYRLELTSTTLRVTTLFALLPGPEVRVMMARSGVRLSSRLRRLEKRTVFKLTSLDLGHHLAKRSGSSTM